MLLDQAIDNLKWKSLHPHELGQNVSESEYYSLHFQVTDSDHQCSEVFYLNQCHGNRIIEHGSSDNNADGVAIGIPGKAAAVRTADCLPITLWSQSSRILKILHVGWRGLVGGIIGNAFTDIQFDKAILGPCIGRASYMVREDLINAFRDMPLPKDEQSLCYNRISSEHYLFDLRYAAILDIIKKGITPDNITIYSNDTYTSAFLASFRRSQDRKKSIFTEVKRIH